MRFPVYKPEKLATPYDGIVIGSGIGALATAAFLGRAGKKVLVLERHYEAGGFTHTFQRKGYEWDVGLHYIGEVHRKSSVLRKVFDHLTNGELTWEKMKDPYDKIIFGDEVYDFYSGSERFKEELKKHFPSEANAIDRYVDLLYQTAAAARNFFAEKAMPAFVAKLARPFLSSKFLRLSDKTTYEVIASLTSDPKLIGVLTAQYGDYGMPPKESSFAIHAMVAKHYIDGGSYPIGGASRIAETFAPAIRAAGGEIFVKAEVQEVLVEGKRATGVRLVDGQEIRAPWVVSDAGVMNTFGRLLSPDVQEQFSLGDKLRQVKPSLAHICIYLGIKESTPSLGLQPSNLWIYPGYDHDENIARYVRDPSSPLPVVYVSFPSAKDPTWETRFPGRTTMEVIGFTPYDWFSRWQDTKWGKRGEDYDVLKDNMAKRLLEQVYRFVPQIQGKIDHLELSTPLSTRHFCNYASGEIYGIEHSPERFRIPWLRAQSPIPKLFLTGQDIVTDGIGGALMAGALTASAVLKKNVLKPLLK